MKRAARVAALEALLARVQANASARREARTSGDAAETPLAPRVEAAIAATPEPRHRGRPARPPPSAEPVDLAPWSSIMERELRDPSPPSVPPPPPIAPPPLSSPRRPSIPPPVDVEPAAPVSMRDVTPAPISVRPPVDVAPESELQRAIREAALAGSTGLEHAAVWNEAASDLRERRSNPPPPAAPVATPPPAATPPKLKPRRSTPRPRLQAATAAQTAAQTAATPAAPRVATPAPPAAMPTVPLIVHQAEAAEDEVPRLRRARRPGAGRSGAAITVVGALIVAVGSLTWAIVERSGSEVTSPRAVPTATTAAPGARAFRASSPPTAITTVADPLPVESAAIVPVPASSSSASSATASAPPPPALRNAAENGLLRIDHRDTVELYLQGVRAGTTNQWLEVACGPKNIRLARPGAPIPGHSFPMWLGEATTLHVRCGEVHAIRWSRD